MIVLHSTNKTMSQQKQTLSMSNFLLWLTQVMSRLWKDSGVQAAYLRANEYQLSDCAKYFLDNVNRLGQHGYIPTTQDILHTRVRTSGIVEVKFHIKVIFCKASRKHFKFQVNCSLELTCLACFNLLFILIGL